MTWMFRQLFLAKEIRSAKGELHFQRWRVFGVYGWFGIYIHRILRSDEDRHMHSHPWSYRTWIVSGGYIEDRWLVSEGEEHRESYGPWETLVRGIGDYHRITLIRPTWTVVLMGRRNDSWGYMVDGVHVDHVTYRENKRKGLYGQ